MKYYLLIDMGYDGVSSTTYNTEQEAISALTEHKKYIEESRLQPGYKKFQEPATIIKGEIVENYDGGVYGIEK